MGLARLRLPTEGDCRHAFVDALPHCLQGSGVSDRLAWLCWVLNILGAWAANLLLLFW